MRFQSVDIARGGAIMLMVMFHFCFDLVTFDLASWDFYRDPFWLHARTVILTTFLLLVGISFALCNTQSFPLRKLFKRQSYLLFCAMSITISTCFYLDERFIFFGVLHFIFVASFINLVFARFFISICF